MRPFAATLFVLSTAIALVRPSPDAGPAVQYRQGLTLLRSGDFTSAAAKAHAGWKNLPASEWNWRLRLLEAEALMEGGKPDEGLALLQGCPPACAECEVRRRVLAARRFVRKTDFARANALLAEARAVSAPDLKPELEMEIDLVRAEIFTRKRDFGAADTLWHAAHAAAETVGDSFRQASAFNGLGMSWLFRSRCDEAVPQFQRALNFWRSLDARYWVAAADNNLAICFSQLGNFESALKARQEALSLIRPSTLLANTLGETGSTLMLQSEPQKAIPYYREACEMAGKFHALTDAARWANNLSQALIATGDWAGAEEAVQRAIQLGPEPRSRIYLDLNAARIAAGRNRFSEARAILERVIASSADNAGVRWEAYAETANLWLASGDPERAAGNFEAAIRVIEDHQSDLRGTENKITFLARLIGFYQNYVGALIDQNQTVKALAIADSSRSRVLAHRFDYHGQVAATLPERAFEAIARDSGAVWLSYWLTPGRSFLWMITPSTIRCIRLGALAEQIAGMVEEYRGFIESMRDPLQVECAAGRRLYELLIAPAASLIPPSGRVIVVPDGALHQLSFETLPVYGGPRPHYWIEDAAVSVAPSFGVFRADRRRSAATRESLLIGDTLSPGPDFPRLENAARELLAVEQRLKPGVTKYVGGEAQPAVWKQAGPGNFDIIHLAAHAEANPHSPLDSAIILSPGNGYRLYARDIIDQPLRADLVTLSACRSSGARTYAGEGLVGLTWAFLQAGARNVVAGLWDVADESTSQLMDRFYAAIAQGTGPAEALRAAQLELLHSSYAKPFYWGPFQCYRR